MIKVFILESDEGEMLETENIFKEQSDFKIVGKEKDGRKGIKKINELKPNLIVVGCFVDTVDGVGIITALRHRSGNCKIILRMAYNIPSAITLAINAGVDYIVHKNIDSMTFLRHCKRLFDDQVIFRRCNDSIKALIKRIVDATGLNPAHVGYRYLIEAIILCYEHPEYLVSKSKGLYQIIAHNHNVNNGTIERAMRSALTYAWNKYEGNLFYKRVNCKGVLQSQKPTCGIYIAAVYNYITSPEVYLNM